MLLRCRMKILDLSLMAVFSKCIIDHDFPKKEFSEFVLCCRKKIINNHWFFLWIGLRKYYTTYVIQQGNKTMLQKNKPHLNMKVEMCVWNGTSQNNLRFDTQHWKSTKDKVLLHNPWSSKIRLKILDLKI